MTTRGWQRIGCGLLATLIAACATPAHVRIEQLRTGMDKTQVLDLAGNPKRTQRQADGDLWTYTYYVGDQHFERDVRFEKGHVVTIFPARGVQAGFSTHDPITRDYEELVNEADSKRRSKP